MSYSSRNKQLLVKTLDAISKRLVLVLRFSSLNSCESFTIRKEMWDASANFMLVKNSIAKIAFVKSEFSSFSEFLSGQVAIAYCDSDVPAFLRLVFDMSKTYGESRFGILCGKCDSQLFSLEMMKVIADYPDESFVYSRLVHTLASAPYNLMSLLNNPSNLLVSYLKNHSGAAVS
jgi:large subunit ribosomal protein L10